MGTHPSKVQSKWKHNQKKKEKANNQQKPSEDPMQSELMATKWQSTITNKS